MNAADRRIHPRVPVSRIVQVARLKEMNSLLATDLSEGGIFLQECPAEIGEQVGVEFEIDELRKVRLRAVAKVVRRSENPPGAGCRFEFFEEGRDELSNLVQTLLNPRLGKELLVVDDSATVRLQICTLLRPLAGLRITEAENGRVALEILRTRSFDAIVTDVSMPELDGFGFVTELRLIPHAAATPVVMITARDEEGDLERAFALGVATFLKKPFQTPDLIFAVCRPLGITPRF